MLHSFPWYKGFISRIEITYHQEKSRKTKNGKYLNGASSSWKAELCERRVKKTKAISFSVQRVSLPCFGAFAFWGRGCPYICEQKEQHFSPCFTYYASIIPKDSLGCYQTMEHFEASAYGDVKKYIFLHLGDWERLWSSSQSLKFLAI